MLIWANEKEINTEMVNTMGIMYGKEFELKCFKPWELSIILRQIQRHFGNRKDISILDFGAGASPFGAYLNYIGYHFVTCLDIRGGWHPEICQETYNRKYESWVTYKKIDVTLGYSGKHDVIFSASVLEHIAGDKAQILRVLSKSLNPDGLFIHVVDYGRGVDFKDLVDNCGIPISYKPEETPGCKEFKSLPEYAWVQNNESRITFFNERGD